jgi:glutamate/aspartate transport system substrate-binding protein
MKKHLLAIAVTALATGTVFAQANDTLAKIKSTGSVTLGVRESSGLGYTLGNGKYVGFHTEMAERILKDIQKQLGLTALEVKYQPVTSQNRIPLVQNGTVDIECGSTTNNTARQKDAAFAFTTYGRSAHCGEGQLRHHRHQGPERQDRRDHHGYDFRADPAQEQAR